MRLLGKKEIRQANRITLNKHVLDALGVKQGDLIIFYETEVGILLRGAEIVET